MRLALGILFVAACAMASDISGIWAGQMPGRNGGSDDISFRFKLSGQTLTGTMFGDEFDLPITEASVEGEQVRFVIVTKNYYSGGSTRFLYTGTIKGNELELVRERIRRPEDSVTTKQQPTKQTIKLKRIP
jgi:hypothetical protein